MIEVGKN